jgi:hypothetical protein
MAEGNLMRGIFKDALALSHRSRPRVNENLMAVSYHSFKQNVRGKLSTKITLANLPRVIFPSVSILLSLIL